MRYAEENKTGTLEGQTRLVDLRSKEPASLGKLEAVRPHVSAIVQEDPQKNGSLVTGVSRVKSNSVWSLQQEEIRHSLRMDYYL